MKRPLEGFQDIQGVLGACILVSKQVVGTTLPAFSGKELLSESIAPMIEALAVRRAMKLPLNCVTVSYGDTRLLIADVEWGMLAVFFQDEADSRTLFSFLESERPQLVEFARRLALQSGPLIEGSGSHNRPVFVKPAATLSTVGYQLDQALAVLTQFLGPVAAVLLDDAIERWLDNGPPTRSRIDQLVEAILIAFPLEVDRAPVEAALRTTYSL